MSWRKIALVLRREYAYNFRRPSFLFTAFGVPLISLGAMILIGYMIDQRESNLDAFRRVGYIDRARIVQQQGPNPHGYFPITDPDVPPPAPMENGSDVGAYFDALEQLAAQQLADGQLDAYFVLGDNYVYTGHVALYTSRKAPEQLREEIEDFLRAQIAVHVPEDVPLPPARLEKIEYVMRDAQTGDELSEAALIGRVMLPLIFVMLYVMATNTTAQFLMSGVVEEKENRLMEILATSIRPLELLWGKLLGLGALALTQIVLWTVAGVLIALLNDTARQFLSGAHFASQDLALLGVLFAFNFLLFAAVMLGIGAAVTAEAESRQLAGVFTMLLLSPLMLMGAYFSDPNGVVPTVLTFVPLTAAMSLLLRITLGGVPAWQLWASLGIQAVTVVGVVALSAKVFRLGMLMYGKMLTPRTLWQALRTGQRTLTSAAEARPARRQRKGWWRR